MVVGSVAHPMEDKHYIEWIILETNENTYIKKLKEDNGDIVYPQTITDAIYTSGGQTLETEISKYVTAEDIASMLDYINYTPRTLEEIIESN